MTMIPAGLGVDLVNIDELGGIAERTKGAFVRRTFSGKEQEEAEKSADEFAYYAGRFAAKEAVFKALAPLLSRKTFDFRVIETLGEPDGSPKIRLNAAARELLDEAGIREVLVSISKGGGCVIAVALAVQHDGEPA
jgi:phosphopantetheine--protein transferase-like protein